MGEGLLNLFNVRFNVFKESENKETSLLWYKLNSQKKILSLIS